MTRKIVCALLCFCIVFSPLAVLADGDEHHDSELSLNGDDAIFAEPAALELVPAVDPGLGAPMGMPFMPPAAPAGLASPAVDVSSGFIQHIPAPATTVLMVGMPFDGGPQVYSIVASSPISGVERILLEDNRLALDIINSTTALSGALPVPPFLAVSGVRVSQFTDDTTRVVFDLEGGTEFSVYITACRTTVFLTIHQHNLHDFSFEGGENFDSIVLNGVRPSAIRVRPVPGYLRFYLANTQTAFATDEELDGSFATHVAISPWGMQSVLLNLAVHDFTAHSIMQTGPQQTTIFLQPATYRNIRYCFEERSLRIPRTNGFEMELSQVSRFDLYHQNTFILWLPVDAYEHIGFGEKLIADTLLRSVDIVNGGHGTQMIFSGNHIFTLDLQADEHYYIIRVLHPREKYPRIVILDPGHGGRFPGAVVGNVREADMNLAVMRKLIQLINADGFMRAYTTRNSDKDFDTDRATDLRLRSQWGNHLGDVFVSIHHNAARSSHTNGIETFYRENIHDSFRQLSSQNFAQILQRNKLNVLGSYDREARSSNFAVLRYSTLPAVLTELGFMTNPTEFARMQTQEFQWQAAQAIYNALLESFMWIPMR